LVFFREYDSTVVVSADCASIISLASAKRRRRRRLKMVCFKTRFILTRKLAISSLHTAMHYLPKFIKQTVTFTLGLSLVLLSHSAFAMNEKLEKAIKEIDIGSVMMMAHDLPLTDINEGLALLEELSKDPSKAFDLSFMKSSLNMAKTNKENAIKEEQKQVERDPSERLKELQALFDTHAPANSFVVVWGGKAVGVTVESDKDIEFSLLPNLYTQFGQGFTVGGTLNIGNPKVSIEKTKMLNVKNLIFVDPYGTGYAANEVLYIQHMGNEKREEKVLSLSLNRFNIDMIVVKKVGKLLSFDVIGSKKN